MAKKVTAAPGGSIDPDQAGRHASGRSRYRAGLVVAATAAVAGLTVTAATTASAAGVGIASASGAPATSRSTSASTATSAAASAAPRRVGAAPQIPADAARVGAPSGSTRVTLSVGLQPRSPAQLQSYAAAVSTKGSPEYHHYLAKGQFASVFGPTQHTIGLVEAALSAQGLKPGKVSADGLAIPVTTTLAQAARAFNTGFDGYRLADGSTGFANTAAPQLSGNVSAYVSGVTGLETLDQRQAMHSPLVTAGTTGTAPAAAPSGGVAARSALAVPATAASGPQLCSSAVKALTQRKLGSDGHGYYSAGNLAGSYNMQHTSSSGAGITIGVFEAENYSASDLAAYQACYDTRVSVSTVKVDGGPKLAPSPAANRGVESLLDLEDLTSLAPGASIIDYEGPDLSSMSNAQWLATYQAMVLDDRAQVLSISYGGCELLTDPAVKNAENYYSLEAAAQGQTIFAASGDSGSVSCYPAGPKTGVQNRLSVNDPASQPYVTGVGGTSMSGSPASSSAAWNSNGGASGGGTSNYWSLPTNSYDYQQGFTGHGFNAEACTPAAGYTCRQVPDVSALADPSDGYPVYIGGGWGKIGGTSGASPTWAALTAIADAQAGCKANGPLGFLNFALYGAAAGHYAADFKDVTKGSNAIDRDSGYTAAPGYDLVTGLGQPNAGNLTAALCGGLPAAARGVSTYHWVNATVVLNTSPNTVPANGVTGAQIEGNSAIPGMPSSGVSSVVLNVTVARTSGSGYLTAWGDNTRRPGTSNLNWQAGQTVSNLVTVPVPADGAVDFFVTGSAAAVTATVQGYYTDDASGQTFTGLTPAPILDTRSAIGIPTRTPVSGVVTVPVVGQGGVPVGATVAVVNLIATDTTGAGSLAASPGTPTANVTDLTWSSKGVTQSGLAFVPIGDDGSIRLLVSGQADVIADVDGYFAPGTGGLSFTGITPSRFLAAPVTGGQTLALQISGRYTVPTGVKYVVMNVTVGGGAQPGYLLTWADQGTPATLNSLSWAAKTAVPNEVVAPVGSDGKVDLSVSSTSELIADVSGYFK